jgi:nitrate reductase gamma subunit
MSGLQVMSYLSVLFFIVALAAKMIKIARMPVHLRWDLYPIPHERGKSEYGGSYFEEVDWWTKPKNFSLFNELKEMAKEIIFVSSVFKYNPRLWIFSFPFHFGMYCLIGFFGLTVLGAIMGAAGIAVTAVTANAFGAFLYSLTHIVGIAGFALSIIGALGLSLSRMLNGELRSATVFGDHLNLLILLAVFVTGLIASLTSDPGFSHLRGYVQSLITLTPAGSLPGIVIGQLWVTIVLLFYFPFTHMTHMTGKYFTYHKVRWEDEPNTRDSKIDRSVVRALGYKQTWSAPHIKSGSTWAEAATAEETNDNE